MKNKAFFDREFHCRGPGDHAKAGNGRESTAQSSCAGDAQEPPAATLRTPNCFIPLVSLGVVAVTVQR
jgi:hypothetical protein